MPSDLRAMGIESPAIRCNQVSHFSDSRYSLRCSLRILTCGVLVLTFLSYTVGQQTTGAIKGTVTDQLGSLVTNARVVLKDGHGSTTSITTNSGGFYEFNNLRPGLYELRIVAPGFVAYEQKGIAVEARQTTTADVQLSVNLKNSK